MPLPEPLLTLQDVRAGYGEAVVLDGVSLEVPEKGSLAVLGRNGVGKSTLLLTIMGYCTLLLTIMGYCTRPRLSVQ